MQRNLLLIFKSCLLLLCSCSNQERAVTPAFYHWQTKVQLTTAEQEHLQQLGVAKLYVKFFDVDWDAASQQAVPQAQVEWGNSVLDSVEIIPTIFITNRTLLNLDASDLPQLAERIATKINQLAKNRPFQEVQFDCDWSPKTQQPYFHLLGLLRKKFNTTIQLSATIRLHQIQYFEQTGVPPVNRGMLMFYNMGNLEDWKTDNSVLGVAIGRSYLGPIQKYPLPLDVALPIFEWGVVFREERLIQLINNLQAEHVQDTVRFLQLSPHRYEVRQSTYLDGYYLYKGDRIRLEAISHDQLQESADLLSQKLSRQPLTVAFYHLDSTTIRQHSVSDLKHILEKF